MDCVSDFGSVWATDFPSGVTKPDDETMRSSLGFGIEHGDWAAVILLGKARCETKPRQYKNFPILYWHETVNENILLSYFCGTMQLFSLGYTSRLSAIRN